MTQITPKDQANHEFSQTNFIETPSLTRLAYREIKGQGPTILWLGGFKSDMGGTKIAQVARLSAQKGWSFVCFDYEAHGESSGQWSAARIGRWRDNALFVADHLTSGPLIVVGSSMGGWMACLLARERPDRVAALGLIAPAPDFVDRLILEKLEPEERLELKRTGQMMLAGYEAPVFLSQAFFDESKAHHVLDAPLRFDGPFHIIHGDKDDVVPLAHGLLLFNHIDGQDGTFEIIKGGDHRLGRDKDLDHICHMVEYLRQQLVLRAVKTV